MKQLFALANLIFVEKDENNIAVKDIQEAVFARFYNILQSFIGASVEERQTSSDNSDKGKLPYGSQTVIGDVILGEMDNHLILYFSLSYNNPTLFIYDRENKTVRNYLDMEIAKTILDDRIYNEINKQLHIYRNLDNLFYHISDMNRFVYYFNEQSLSHLAKSSDDITGYECFEIDMDDYEL